jgi:hypothetical protein
MQAECSCCVVMIRALNKIDKHDDVGLDGVVTPRPTRSCKRSADRIISFLNELEAR